jgi:hypothetical protein
MEMDWNVCTAGNATWKVPLLSLQVISIKTVVSPVKDKFPKEDLTIASICFRPYHIERSRFLIRELSHCGWYGTHKERNAPED